jgi:hypothetical protein
LKIKTGGKTRMENENLDQYKEQEKRIEPKISVSRDGKWVIIRMPGVEQPIIKSVNYLKAILANAEKRMDNTQFESTLRKVKDLEKNG